MRRLYTALALAIYASLPVLANWMIGNVGTPIPSGPHVIPVGFGLYAPSGVLCAGAALAMRDLVQELAGRRGAVLAILVGACISYLVASPFIALASAVAFLLSEALDFGVYTPLRQRGQIYAAVAASNTAGLLVDTAVFLGLSGLLTPGLFAGQVVGKVWMTLLALALLWGARRVGRNNVHVGFEAA
jgi:queuosine precursor transporter